MRTLGIILAVPLGITAALLVIGWALGRRALNREWARAAYEDKFVDICAICLGNHRTLDHLYPGPEPS